MRGTANEWQTNVFGTIVNKPWLLAILSGILLVMSFPSFNLSFLAWFALVPLLVAIRRANTKRAFLLGLVTGFFYFLGMTYWIIPLGEYSHIALTIFATLLLTGYLSVYVGVFVVMLKVGARILPVPKADSYLAHLIEVFLAPIIWTALELVRGWLLTGFPWGSMGYSQWNNLPAIQIASVIGVYGISFLIVLVNATLTRVLLLLPAWRRGLFAAIPTVIILIAVFVYGFIQLGRQPSGQKMTIAIVPGNISQIEKWERKNLKGIFNKYLKTTEQLMDVPPDMVVWPETSIPANSFVFVRKDMFSQIVSILKSLNAPLLFGIPYGDYNAAFLLSPEGEVLSRYYKIHLVPFGEYVPLKHLLPAYIREKVTGVADFEKGKQFAIFPVPKKKPMTFGIVICFESAFPDFFRQFVRSGAHFMGVVTNDAWFTGTAAPEQHFTMSVFRAVENRRDIFHAANGGISAFVDKYGRISRDKITPTGDGFVIGDVYSSQGKTIYTRYGDWLPLICLLLIGTMLVWMVFRQFKKWGDGNGKARYIDIRR